MRRLLLKQLVDVALAVAHHHPRLQIQPSQLPALLQAPQPAPTLQGLVTEPSQALLNVPVQRIAVRESDFHFGAASQEPLNLFRVRRSVYNQARE